VKRPIDQIATDTVFSNTPAAESGYIAAQFFVARHSLVAEAYGLKLDKVLVNRLEDNIRERRDIDKLISYCAKAKISSRVKDILCALFIETGYSITNCENQNFKKVGTAQSRQLLIVSLQHMTTFLAICVSLLNGSHRIRS
jgi:hypothetical protein